MIRQLRAYLCSEGARGLQQLVIHWIEQFGYWGVFLLIAVENLFPPIPSEVILTFTGFLTTCTALRVPGAVAAATAGSVAGALLLYGGGRLLSPARLTGILGGPVGKALKLEPCDVEKAAGRFTKSGAASVFWCRCVPIVRSLISIPAGMAGMGLGKFLLYTTAGSTVWNILLIGLGALAGKSWPAVTAALENFAGWVKVLLWVLAAAAVVRILWVRRKKKKERFTDGDGKLADAQ